MFCPQCGTPNENEANFCKQCGIKMVSGGPTPPGQPRPQAAPRKGCCSCSCSGFITGCFFLFFICLGFLAYVLYSGPEFATKIFGAPDDRKTEMAALNSVPADADVFENILVASQKHFSTSDRTAEIVFKESEINAFVSRELTKAASQIKDKDTVQLNKFGIKDVAVSEVKFGLSPAGFKLFISGRLMKLESLLFIAGNISVEDADFKFLLTDCQLGKMKMPISFLMTLWGQLKPNFKIQKGTNVMDIGKLRIKVNKIKFEDKQVRFECEKVK